MKLFFINGLFLLHSLFLNGQILDSAQIRVVYKMAYKPDSTKSQNIKTDIWFLLIGEKVSNFFSYNRFRQDSVFNESLKNGTVQEFLQNPALRNKYENGGLYSYSNLFLNYPEGRITIKDQIGNNKYIYDEEKSTINWKIFDDTTTILNYTCQKAIATFRGREYIAWFTQQIPISSGPYKFDGLPGLILRIADTKNNYNYECSEIKFSIERNPIIIQRKDCIRTTREAFRKAFQYSFENPFELLKGNVTSRNGKEPSRLNPALQKGLPYNPIELE